jgi:hypothetical protein
LAPGSFIHGDISHGKGSENHGAANRGVYVDRFACRADHPGPDGVKQRLKESDEASLGWFDFLEPLGRQKVGQTKLEDPEKRQENGLR